MPRTKGSKNRPKTTHTDYAFQIAEKQEAIASLTAEITSITANIDTLKADLKEKKTTLKKAEKEVASLEAKKAKADAKAAEEAKKTEAEAAHASRIISSDACLYYYTMRPSGALLRNRGLSLVENKLYLLEERRKIVEYLNSRGFSKSVWDFAGSNVMSVIELMVKCSFSDRKKVNEYIKHPLVKKSIYIMPRIGIKK